MPNILKNLTSVLTVARQLAFLSLFSKNLKGTFDGILCARRRRDLAIVRGGTRQRVGHCYAVSASLAVYSIFENRLKLHPQFIFD